MSLSKVWTWGSMLWIAAACQHRWDMAVIPLKNISVSDSPTSHQNDREVSHGSWHATSMCNTCTIILTRISPCFAQIHNNSEVRLFKKAMFFRPEIDLLLVFFFCTLHIFKFALPAAPYLPLGPGFSQYLFCSLKYGILKSMPLMWLSKCPM